jgi:hypothetical protein
MHQSSGMEVHEKWQWQQKQRKEQFFMIVIIHNGYNMQHSADSSIT